MNTRVAFAMLLAASSAFAQFTCPPTGSLQDGGASIGTIPNGAILTGSESWYDPATETLQVVVIKPLNPDCEVRVQGMIPTRKNGIWIVEVPVGSGVSPQWASPPFIYQGLRYHEIPYIGALADRHRTMKPLIRETIHIPTETAVARTRILIWDKRNDSGFDPSYTGSLTYSLGSELSNTGVDALEEVHAATLPNPSLASFNTLLTNYFTGTKWPVNPPTGFGNPDKSCMPLKSADVDFLQTSAYISALAAAGIEYAAYETAKNACNSPNPFISIPGCAAASQSCVRDKTQNAKNFELCIGKIDGTGKSLSLAGVNSADLSITNVVPLTSRIVLGRLDSTVDGVMAEMFIRWSDKHIGCTLRPKANLTLADEVRPAVITWKTCTGLEADATSATTQGPIRHSLPTSLETIDATATDPNPPLFALGPTNRNPDKGACSDPNLRSYVLTLLDLFYPTIESAINANWLPQHRVAVDNLMSRWEAGVWENAPDLTLTENLHPVVHRANDRITMHYDSDASWPGASFSTIVYSPPGPFPCFDPISVGAPSISCVLGLNVFNQPFDASFTVTANAFNQLIRERLHDLTIVPTFDQLNVTPPAGKIGSDIWEFDGNQLTAILPAFSALGTTKLRMAMFPGFTPYAYIPRDPLYWFNSGVADFVNPPPLGRAPLTYQMTRYRISLVGDQPGPDGTYDWFEFILDLYDPDFQLRTATNGGRNVIIPAYSDKLTYALNMTKSQLTNCAVRPVPVKSPGCGELLTAAVDKLVVNFLKDTALSLVKDFPAPQYYDASGTSPVVVEFNQKDRKYQAQQVITFYGNLKKK